MKKDLRVTSDLTINSSHIPTSVAINDSVTRESIFLHNQNLELLIKEFIAEFVRWQEINFDKVLKMHSMVNEDSLPSRVRFPWFKWIRQVPIFRFNSGKYNLNMVKYYFVKTISN